MRMPSIKFQSGDTVMGRWPGSSLFYEVKVLSYDAKSQLYTVIYKDGTELELREADMKNPTGFKPSRRSRSRSPSRRRSRSRSPARTTRRSSSRTVSGTFIAETHTARKEPKLKEALEVRLIPVAKPVENNSNNKHENKEGNDTSDKVNELLFTGVTRSHSGSLLLCAVVCNTMNSRKTFPGGVSEKSASPSAVHLCRSREKALQGRKLL